LLIISCGLWQAELEELRSWKRLMEQKETKLEQWQKRLLRHERELDAKFETFRQTATNAEQSTQQQLAAVRAELERERSAHQKLKDKERAILLSEQATHAAQCAIS
jgi:hypothetical protein